MGGFLKKKKVGGWVQARKVTTPGHCESSSTSVNWCGQLSPLFTSFETDATPIISSFGTENSWYVPGGREARRRGPTAGLSCIRSANVSAENQAMYLEAGASCAIGKDVRPDDQLWGYP